MTDIIDEGKVLVETAPWDEPQAPPLHKDLPEPCAHTVEAAKDFKGQSAIPEEELERITQGIIAALKTVYDPEIPVDIYELGLIYKIDISDERTVDIEMTLTAPGCPVAGEMPAWVENAVGAVDGVGLVKVQIVFNPPWDPSRMSDEARVALNMF
jgi:FeS assembly SUF system protein